MLNTRHFIYTIALVAPLVQMPCALASEPAETAQHESGTHHEEAQHHQYHPNLIALFTGVTTQGRREGSPTLGIEYGHRFNKSFSIGAVVEHAFSDESFWIYAVPFAWHIKPWKLYIAPGIENSDDHGNQPLLRLGVEYVFDVGPMEIAPQLDADFVDGHAVAVIGVSFGYGF